MKQFAQNILNRLRGKKTGPEIYNIYHPDFAEAVEPAFQVNGVQYYRFIKDTSMPWGRYMFLQTFLSEQSLRMDTELLKGYCLEMKKAVNGNLKNGIDLTRLIRIVTQMESRVELAFEVDTTYRLAAVIYFDDTEDLYTYDKAYNDKKVVLWKEAKVVDFFYTRPASELLGLSGSSPEDLQTFITQQTELLKILSETTATPEP
jgi:hypothetical protein